MSVEVSLDVGLLHLMKQEAFWYRLIEFSCCLIGLLRLYEVVTLDNIIADIIVYVAIVGGTIYTLLMLMLYTASQKSRTTRIMLLWFYGNFNLAATFIIYKYLRQFLWVIQLSKVCRCFEFFKPPIVKDTQVMFLTCGITGVLMVGEVLWKTSNYLNGIPEKEEEEIFILRP